MSSKRVFYRSLVAATLVMVFIALAGCKKAAEINEAASTLEAELVMTVDPKLTPDEPESPAAETPAAAPQAGSMEEATATAGPPTLGMPELEEYVSVTEFFSLDVPAGWSAEETFLGGAMRMANSEAALERFRNGQAAESGDFVANVGFLPFALFRQRELVPLGIQFEAAPDAFLASILPVFNLAGEVALSEPTLVTTEGGRQAGMVTASGDSREGLILLVAAGDGVVALISTSGFPGEAAAFQPIAHAIADGVAFSGAEEALYGAFLSR